MKKIGVIGAGSWGIALARLLDGNGHDVCIWSIDEKEIAMLSANREQKDKLPGVILSEAITYTTDLKTAIEGKDLLVLAVPSVFIRSTARKMSPYVSEGQIIVNVAKGIEEDTLMILTDIIEEEIPQAQVAVLSGPSHAEEVGKDIPTVCVVGAKKRELAEEIQNYFMNQTFRIYTSPDLLGIELGGALKNVIALAAGMADGLGFGDNTKAALMTRGIAEISRLALAMGAKAETLGGLTGIGDLIVTCGSVHSRNRRAGVLMGQGKTMEEATAEVKMVVEGIYSAKAAAALGEKYGISLPIIEQVNQVLFAGQSAQDGVMELMIRDRKSEYQDLLWKEV